MLMSPYNYFMNFCTLSDSSKVSMKGNNCMLYLLIQGKKIWQQWFPDALDFSVTKIEVVIILIMLNLEIAICELFMMRCVWYKG